ncbi:DDB1- and CUL4-associated factor 5 [Copidosoma floridanum]|uniref:DDB1- and CUL4-associated factor 5 n=1 Tax=Copidosoma floridanum TaxID=29053 RepID=UPI0006C9E1E1|nr:DDB1- and CUL4-associated factor 5 [Copidosoma floridanum]XP_014214693.1 DDB1- and CUL4-associated factor 5 [Copidosoma floridanum]XP_014214694.1 DDB1- and CUL4-associated factor 5 [Copidosoma floridanum]XP_014214695.1 DDB1- and CUL4-associated factor 5 [Copidosoma floridanum]XP_014214696.1 DDB1- and CUL4-associated factor 5 [Copidosoma floridanum]
MEENNSESRRRKKQKEEPDDDNEEDEEEQQEPGNRWRSCCRRCGKKKRKQKHNHHHHHHHSQEDEEETATKGPSEKHQSAAPVALQPRQLNPCNPLGYILNRQIDHKINHCKRLVDARFLNSKNLFRKDLYAHFGCINAIEFSPEGDFLISGGDDKRVLLWKVEQAIQEVGKPVVMKAQHMSNIFCLGYNCSKTKIFSAGNDDQVIVHDLQTTDVLNCFRHEKPVYGLSIHPHNDNVFSSACDDGRILIYDIRGTASSPETFFCIAQHKNPFHSVMFNPVDPITLATANTKEGVSLWDVRKPLTPVLRYGSESPAQSCMSVRFDKTGKLLLALRRRLPPVLYSVNSPDHLCQFDHPGYYNSCTMKSCCFAGNDDEYVLSGSDDFQLYMWKIPTDDTVKWIDSAHMVLRGHRSIVNQVRYNQASCLLASSGVEKVIKLWSPFPIGDKCQGGLKRDVDKGATQRRVYSHEEYIALVLRSGQFMTHDYSHQSTDEDQRMMAFFDSLVQREIESWSSEDLRTPQSPTDIENNNTTDQNNSSDSYDSAASDNRMMRCYITSTPNNTVNSHERPLDSPNRITRLIANKRDKLMRHAALGNNTQQLHSRNTMKSHRNHSYNTSAANAGESGSTSEPENTGCSTRSKSKNKINLRSKAAKRKHGVRVSKRTRARRKQNNAKDDSDSEPEVLPPSRACKSNNYQSVDATQPSTSTGVISSRRYAAPTLRAKPRRRQSRSSSSSSEDVASKAVATTATTNKRTKSTKSDSDSSAKEAPTQKRKQLVRNKSKVACASSYSRRDTRSCKNKRQKINHPEVEGSNSHAAGNSRQQRDSATSVVGQNGGSCSAMQMVSTPPPLTRSSKRSVAASDSGIGTTVEKSGASTVEKRTRFGRAESSDRERSTKNYELFTKRVDQVRRGYRKRSMPTDSDSSDE